MISQGMMLQEMDVRRLHAFIKDEQNKWDEDRQTLITKKQKSNRFYYFCIKTNGHQHNQEKIK